MFNPAAFAINNKQLGEDIAWYRADPCSCYDPATNYDQQEGCTACESGYIYRRQFEDQNLRAIVTEVRREYMHADFGFLQVGDIILQTIAEELRPGMWGRIELLDREEEQVARCDFGVRDTLTNAGTVTQIISITDSTTEYVPYRDFEVDLQTNTVEWLPGGETPTKVYVVRFRQHPRYFYVGSDVSGARPTQLSSGLSPVIGKLVRERGG